MFGRTRDTQSAVTSKRYKLRLFAPFLLGGACLGFGIEPYGWWPIAFIALIGVFYQSTKLDRARDLCFAGWLTGFGYFGLTLNWIVEPFFVDAAVTGWMAPFALGLMAAGLALFWAAAFWLWGQTVGRSVYYLAVFWALSELARGYVLTGFPWALVGYIWAPVDVVQWLSVIGPYGLTFVSFLTAASVACCLKGGQRVTFIAVPISMLGALFIGGLMLRPDMADTSDRPVVRLVQPNAAQHEKWDRDMIPVFFQRQLEFTGADWQLDGPPNLVIWPETALPMLLNHADQAFEMMSTAAGQASVAVGIQREEQGAYFNSLVTLDGKGQVSSLYDKHHLVPFGEYMPASWLFEKINIFGLAARPRLHTALGPGPAVIDLGDLGTARPLICYEAVFPNNMRGSGPRPDFLLQITNDAWFGNWSGPFQHLGQARMRAIEQGLPLVRSANTGISAVIDGAGRITAQIGLNEAGFVDAKLPAPLPPTVYAITGDRVIFLLLFACALLIYWQENRNRPLTGR